MFQTLKFRCDCDFLEFYALCICQGRKCFIRLVINVYLSLITALLLNHSYLLSSTLFYKEERIVFSFYIAFKYQRQMPFFLPTGFKPSFQKIKQHYELSLEMKKYGFQ